MTEEEMKVWAEDSFVWTDHEDYILMVRDFNILDFSPEEFTTLCAYVFELHRKYWKIPEPAGRA